MLVGSQWAGLTPVVPCSLSQPASANHRLPATSLNGTALLSSWELSVGETSGGDKLRCSNVKNLDSTAVDARVLRVHVNVTHSWITGTMATPTSIRLIFPVMHLGRVEPYFLFWDGPCDVTSERERKRGIGKDKEVLCHFVDNRWMLGMVPYSLRRGGVCCNQPPGGRLVFNMMLISLCVFV